MTQEQKIIRVKAGLLELAKQLGNVSQACKMMGYSRDSFYRFKELYDKGGELALQEISRRKPILKNRTPIEIEKAAAALAAQQTAWGQVAVSDALQRAGVSQFYDEHGIRLSRVLSDRGTEFCGSQSHEYELYLAVEDIDHTRTKAKSPQTNGICERFHRTVLDEFYRVAFRKKIYRTVDELQADLDAWIVEYNERRPHQGRWCFGKTPMQTFLDALPLVKEKMMAA